MPPSTLDRLYSALVIAQDVLSELVGHQDERLQVMRMELSYIRESLEQEVNPQFLKPVNGSSVRRPTLLEAVQRAPEIGVTEKEAEDWFYAREATDWMRGTMGGGSLPVGQNWAADLKTFTNACRERQNGQRNGKESVWHLRQSLEAVEAELGRIETDSLYDGLSLAKRELRDKLRERKREIRAKIAGME